MVVQSEDFFTLFCCQNGLNSEGKKFELLCSKRAETVCFSLARMTPSVVRIPMADPALLMASIAYSTCIKRPGRLDHDEVEEILWKVTISVEGVGFRVVSTL